MVVMAVSVGARWSAVTEYVHLCRRGSTFTLIGDATNAYRVGRKPCPPGRLRRSADYVSYTTTFAAPTPVSEQAVSAWGAVSTSSTPGAADSGRRGSSSAGPTTRLRRLCAETSAGALVSAHDRLLGPRQARRPVRRCRRQRRRATLSGRPQQPRPSCRPGPHAGRRRYGGPPGVSSSRAAHVRTPGRHARDARTTGMAR